MYIGYFIKFNYIMQAMKKSIQLYHIQTKKCDNSPLYPYYPIITSLSFAKELYIATKSKQKILIIVLDEKQTEKSYIVLCQELVSKMNISSLQFFKIEIQESKNIDNAPTINLYLFVGCLDGSLYLLKINKNIAKIFKKYNKTAEIEASLFTKTLSYFSFTQMQGYPRWQKTSIMKINSRKNELSYLFRNSILVIVNSISSNIQQLQKKFDKIILNSNPKTGTYQKIENFIYFKSQNIKFIKDNEGAILSLQNTISNYYIDDNKLIVSTFQGELYFFDKNSFACLEVIKIGITIKNINCYKKFIFLCLQDDTVQIIDLSQNLCLNMAGHKSFPNQTSIYQNFILISSFDGSLSVTTIPSFQKWSQIKKDNKNLRIVNDQKNKFMISDYLIVGKGETGIGNFIIEKNIIIFAMLDNCIKIYKIN